MAYAYPGDGALDYFPCRYGTSKLLFRGPPRALDQRYCAVLGGTETYGKFVSDPYPALVERATGLRMVNLGCVNAGPDVFLNDAVVLDIVARAEMAVVQVLGAQNLTNRYYAVHPRRNDRFLRAEPLLQSLYPEVDFTEFHFTRHMLRSLHVAGPVRFKLLAQELRACWLARMAALLARLSGRAVLLWLADRPPADQGHDPNALRDPILIDAAMIATVRGMAADYVEVAISAEARAAGVAGMAFSPLDRLAAAEVPGPAAHREVAAALAPRLLRLR